MQPQETQPQEMLMLTTLKFATGLADQSYGSYVSLVLRPISPERPRLRLGRPAWTGLGTALNSSYTNQGNAANTTQTTIGNNNARPR
jgi:hypothetical protein